MLTSASERGSVQYKKPINTKPTTITTIPRIWIYFSFIGIIESTFKNTLSLTFISMKRIAPYFAAVFAALILAVVCMAQTASADLVLTNANIHTMDGKRTVAR